MYVYTGREYLTFTHRNKLIIIYEVLYSMIVGNNNIFIKIKIKFDSTFRFENE